MCIKWRLKLPFCLFCRLCSISLESLLPLWVFPRSELATSPLFWGGERSSPFLQAASAGGNSCCGSLSKGQRCLGSQGHCNHECCQSRGRHEGRQRQGGRSRAAMQEIHTRAAPSLCRDIVEPLEPAPFSIKCSTEVGTEPRGLASRFLPRRSCSTEQEDLKMNVRRAAPGHLPGRAARRQIDCKRPRARVACSLPGLLECCGVFWCNLTHTSFLRDHRLVPCNRRARTNSLGSGFLLLPSSTTNPFDSD